MFDRVVERRRRECKTVGELLRLSPDVLVMASPSDVFESVGFAVSIVHAAASAAVIATEGEQREAYALQAFFEGAESHSHVPARLGAGGAYSCISQNEGTRLASWLQAISRSTYEEEVADMFGGGMVAVYRSGLDSLSQIMGSLSVHGADLCCVQVL